MNLFAHFRDIVIADLAALDLPPGLEVSRVAVEPPREPAHGDIATNAAMVLAKPAGLPPRSLAERLAERLRRREEVTAAEVAGPGFINIRLADAFWQARLAEILRAGTAYGDAAIGAGRRVNVEYVSANPTGPMHVGHGRGAVVGDALASLLRKAGFAVTREYYINDAGAQVEALAWSAYFRYLQALGAAIDEKSFAGFQYQGDYLVPVGQALKERYGESLADRGNDGAIVGKPLDEWLPAVRDVAVAAMMELIRADLAAIGIAHDVFTSERAIVESGAVDRALATLEAADLIYVGTLEPPKGKLPEDWEERPQTLFRSTRFGDDIDRPLKKSDGSWTYFAGDIAYHLDKYRRGFADMIDVWGADHGGYVKRMQAAVTALSGAKARLDVKLCQLVNLFDKGVPVKMSKRAGTFVTLREVVEEVGKDVFRFVMLTRRNDQALDFDFAKVVEQSKDNPVFYVQYAHARACSVLRHAAQALPSVDLTPESLASAPLERLTDPAELALIRHLASWPRLVEGAAEAHEPHRIAFYLGDLAAQFHGLWNKGRDDASLRFLLGDAPELSRARLALVQAVAIVVASGLTVFGVAPAEEM
ncbi:MAG TPA: arginine--tRNA ligase [Stellaceae bacterium]|nr:arginine--tRNA ligase [Stellaceae bacterium]